MMPVLMYIGTYVHTYKQRVPELHIGNYKKLGRFLCAKIFLYSLKRSSFLSFLKCTLETFHAKKNRPRVT
jgi:hypothetical protein